MARALSHRPGVGWNRVKKSLAPELYLPHPAAIRGGWIYIMTNKPNGVLYIGVCADIVARVGQHREGRGSAFCKRYNLTRLVYAELSRRLTKRSTAKRQ